jgi:hypothetical protein
VYSLRYINSLSSLKIMRGRWASAALGAGIARRRMGYEMDQQAEAHEAEMQRAQQQIEAPKAT